MNRCIKAERQQVAGCPWQMSRGANID